MKISGYKPEHEKDILRSISIDPDWEMLTNPNTIEIYKNLLKIGVTYVCYSENEFCGYVRAILDKGLAIYVSELYVVKKWRNHKIGQSLLEQVKHDFSDLKVYALSDEDAYYHKKGYRKIGSVFEL